MKQLVPFPVQVLIVVAVLVGLYLFQKQANLAEEYVTYGDQFLASGNYFQAARQYNHALKFDGDNAEIYFKLGSALASSADREVAVIAYQKALEFGYSRPASAYAELGWTQFYLTRYDDAKLSFEAALQGINAAPQGTYTGAEYARIFSGLGWVTLRTVDCEAAVPYFQQSLEYSTASNLAQLGLDRCKDSAASK